MASLRDIACKIGYGPQDDRLRDFFIPALANSIRYDRADELLLQRLPAGYPPVRFLGTDVGGLDAHRAFLSVAGEKMPRMG